ncbi:MAG: hypothetical protein VB142_05515 [Burkholderia sp.]
MHDRGDNYLDAHRLEDQPTCRVTHLFFKRAKIINTTLASIFAGIYDGHSESLTKKAAFGLPFCIPGRHDDR